MECHWFTGWVGSTNLNEIGRQITQLEDNSLLTVSLLMMMAGLCFKIAEVPFHMWVPDAYEGGTHSHHGLYVGGG